MHKHKLRLRGPGQHCQRQVHGVSAIRPTRHNHRPVAEDLPRLVRTVGGHGHNNGVNYPRIQQAIDGPLNESLPVELVKRLGHTDGQPLPRPRSRDDRNYFARFPDH